MSRQSRPRPRDAVIQEWPCPMASNGFPLKTCTFVLVDLHLLVGKEGRIDHTGGKEEEFLGPTLENVPTCLQVSHR